jgi:small subunit ribosomal protein S6
MSEAAVAELPPRLYEAIYILRPDVSKDAAEKVAVRVQEVIARGQGNLTLVESWGRRPLAYAIGNKKRGVYVYINYLGDGALVAELERNFRMLDEVIRFQTVKLTDEGAAPESGEVRIEAYEPPPEGEDEEWTIEQELGLVQAPRRSPEDSDDSDGPDRDEEEEE